MTKHRRRWRNLVIAAALGACVVRPGNMGAAPTQDRTELEGVWLAVSGSHGEMKAPAELIERVNLTFKGSRLKMVGISGPTDDAEEVEFTLDASVTPRRITYTDAAKTRVLGIYRLENDQLTLALARGAQSYPVSFKSEKGVLLLVLKKG